MSSAGGVLVIRVLDVNDRVDDLGRGTVSGRGGVGVIKIHRGIVLDEVVENSFRGLNLELCKVNGPIELGGILRVVEDTLISILSTAELAMCNENIVRLLFSSRHRDRVVGHVDERR